MAEWRNGTDQWVPIFVPKRYYFVLGDNRHNSRDSRYTGFVKKKIGRGRC